MHGSIYLIGGGEIGKEETKAIDDHMIASIPQGSTLVFFPTAAGDSQGYIQTIKKVFGKTSHVEAITQKTNRPEIVRLLKLASIVYIGGGKTELLMDFSVNQNLVPVLRDIFRARSNYCRNERGSAGVGCLVC